MTNNDRRFEQQDTLHTNETQPHPDRHVGQEPESRPSPLPHDHGDRTGHGGHGWMMALMCAPMLIIAMVLVATGTAGAGSIVVALGCMLMMAVMMRGMGGHGGGGR